MRTTLPRAAGVRSTRCLALVVVLVAVATFIAGADLARSLAADESVVSSTAPAPPREPFALSGRASTLSGPASAPSSPASAPSSPASAPSDPASAPASQRVTHAHHRFDDTERYVKMFEDPARAEYQKPQEVVAALHLRPAGRVADIGAGSGYFTFPMARAVGPEGTVFAIDIEQGMIDYVKARANREAARNVITILAAPGDAGLASASVDLIFICDTWHHIEQRVAYLRRLRPALRPGGRIAIVDYQKRELPVGPPVEAKIDRADVVKELEEAGFGLAEEHTFLPYQYFLVFSAATPARPPAGQ